MITSLNRLRDRLLDRGAEIALRHVNRSGDTRVLALDYPPSASGSPRYTRPHPQLDALIESGRERYAAALSLAESYVDDLARIDLTAPDGTQPSWRNDFLPGLDAAVLYALLRAHAPRRYVEIGSGNSTKFAARARADGRLGTRIVSIDPHPRAEVDALCDEVVRDSLEMVDMSLWETIGPGDMVFMDGSHRVFTNSDAVAFFLDVLPALPPGVLVAVHDIYLPYDYPAEIGDRYYSEQYLLAAWLLGGARADVLFPAYWSFERMRPQVERLWASHPHFASVEPHGVAFWLRTR